MKIKNIEKALKSIVVCEGIALATFIPNISKMVGNINQSVHAGMASVSNVGSNMVSVATKTTIFGYSNMWFIALLLVAIMLPALDVILKNDSEGDR